MNFNIQFYKPDLFTDIIEQKLKIIKMKIQNWDKVLYFNILCHKK